MLNVNNIMLVAGLSVVCSAQCLLVAQTKSSTEAVPFTQVKMSEASFWGHRIKAARDVTIPLAFSK